MSISPGYDSRCCFCLWSQGHPEQAIRENHKTILHTLWEEEHFYVDVEDNDEILRFSCCRVLWSLGAYPVGMVGYLIDIIIKTVLAIGNFFTFIIAIFSFHTGWMQERELLFLDNLAALGISIIGLFIPPLAYRLDHTAQEYFLKKVQDIAVSLV